MGIEASLVSDAILEGAIMIGFGGAQIRPVRRQTFREQIVEELRSSIMSGQLAPGSQIIEADLAVRFGVSRGPLREALRHLIEEGLLVTVPYTGTHVTRLSLDDIQEIFSLRTELEIFAFKLIWERRDHHFRDELHRRHECLLKAIDEGDDEENSLAELSLHSYVYETCGHKILLNIWNGLKGRLQLYWAAYNRTYDRDTKRDGHIEYVRLATADDFEAMAAEIRVHMLRGVGRTEAFLAELSGKPKTSMAS